MAAASGSPTQYQGQSWLTWSDKFGFRSDDNSDLSEDEAGAKIESDSMKLRKEDMTLFGFCPARDKFFLVVCEMCGIVVKPQALQHHIDIRHGGRINFTEPVINNKLIKSPDRVKIRNSSSTNKEKSKKNHYVSQSKQTYKTDKVHSNSVQSPNSKNLSSILPSPQKPPPPPDPGKTKYADSNCAKSSDPSKHSNSPSVMKTSCNQLDVDRNKNNNNESSKSKCLESSKVMSSDQSKSKSLTSDKKLLSDQVSNSKNSSPSSSSKKVSNSSNGGHSKKSKSKSNKERKLLLCKDREYDPDKHCGVMVSETGKSCTRSLTCKTHSLALRRAVPGRKTNFDELLSEHRAAKEVLLKAAQSSQSKVPCASPPKLVQSPSSKAVRPSSLSSLNLTPKSQSPGPPPLMKQSKSCHSTSPNKPTSMPNLLSPKETVNNLSSFLRVSDSLSPECGSPNKSMESTLTSRNSESVYRPKPPKPVAMCTFGGRRVGHGYYVFNRKQDVFRSVFKALVTECTKPSPSKKLCLESRLPPVPDPANSDDPSDPYSFTYTEQQHRAKVASPKSNGFFSSPALSLNNSTKHSNTFKVAETENNAINLSNISASLSLQQNSKKRRTSISSNSSDNNVNSSHEITVSIPESSANMAVLPSPSLNPAALLENHLNNTPTLNSVEDFNIVVTNVDVINGQTEHPRLDATLPVKTVNAMDQVVSKQSETCAKSTLKSKSKKPPILAKAQNSLLLSASLPSNAVNHVSGNVSAQSPFSNGISLNSSPLIQNKIANSISSNKVFANHRIVNSISSNQIGTINRGSNKFNNSSLTTKKLTQKSKLSSKPAQFINLTQALSSDRNTVLTCDTTTPPVSTISYQQVFANQVLGFSHLQLQTTGQKTNLSPTISLNSSQIKIPFLRTSTSPSVPSQQTRPLLLASESNLSQSDLPGSPSLPS